MAFLDIEKIEAIKTHFPYVTIMVLCYVVINLFQQNGELYKEVQRVNEVRIREANERAAQERTDKKYYLDLYFDYINARGK